MGHFYFVIIIVQFYILMPLWVYALRRVTPAVGIAFSVFNLGSFWDIIYRIYYT